MSYTTNKQPQGIPLDLSDILREALIAEIVAIDGYEFAIANTDNKEVVEIFHHILEDEKRHYGMFLEFLRRVDKEQMEMFKEAQEHVTLTQPKEGKNDGKSSKYKEKGDLLTFIRENIKGELEAIVLYDQHEAQIKDEEGKKIFRSVIRDEKEHVEELTKAMIILDKDKYGPIG